MNEVSIGIGGGVAAIVLVLAGLMLIRKLVKLALFLFVLAGLGIILYARYGL